MQYETLSIKNVTPSSSVVDSSDLIQDSTSGTMPPIRQRILLPYLVAQGHNHT